MEPLIITPALVLPGASTLPPMRSNQPPASPPPDTGDKTLNKANRKQAADRFGTLNAFCDCALTGLSRVEIATWLILYRDTRNGIACTAQADVARRAGCSVRGVQKAIPKLIAKGLLIQVFRGGLNRGPSGYRAVPLTNRGS